MRRFAARAASRRIALTAVLLLSVAGAAAAEAIGWVWPTSGPPPATMPEAAVLVQALTLHGDAVESRPRARPLVLAGTQRLVPVVHVIARPSVGDALSPAQHRAVLGALQAQAARAAGGRVQLDFEAPPRLRAAWRALVAEARRTLPSSVALSVTALAGWCRGGAWLDDLAADEVVPMLYRMGPDTPALRSAFASGSAELHRACRGPAIGFAVQEPPGAALQARYRRHYWFHERGWSRPDLTDPPRP